MTGTGTGEVEGEGEGRHMTTHPKRTSQVPTSVAVPIRGELRP